MKNNKLMLDLPPIALPPIVGIIKKAELGGSGNDNQFEQSFSNLAHAYLKDKAPGLLDYEVGFELMERNEDSTKAVGIFGFKVGSQWLYAPVFFINGDLKGHELLYLKDQDQFVPLKENWLNYLLRRKPAQLGKKTDSNMARLGFMSPNLQAFSRPPTKFASAENTESMEMAEGIKQLAKYACSNPENDPKFSDNLTLESFLVKEANHSKDNLRTLIKGLVASCQQFPKIAGALDKVYGEGFIKSAINYLKTLPEPEEVIPSSNRYNTQEKKALTIMIRSFSSSSDGVMGVSEADKKKLLTDGVIFKDARTSGDVSTAFKVQQPTSLENPPLTGVYDLLVSPFAMRRVMVFLSPHGPDGRKDFATVVSYEGEKDWTNSHPANLFTRTPRDEGGPSKAPQSFNDFFEGLSSISSLSKGTLYMAVGPNGDCTVPFMITKTLGDSDGSCTYRVQYKDHASQPRPSFLPKTYSHAYSDHDGCASSSYGGDKALYVTDKPGLRVKSIKGCLYIPGSFKVVKLNKDSGYDGSISPGNLADVQHAVYQKTASLTVRHTGTEVNINGAIFDQQGALVHLIRDLSLREKQARVILDEARLNKKAMYRRYTPDRDDAGDLIKSAAPGDPMDPSMQGVTSAPPFPVPASGMEPIRGGSVQSSYPTQETMPVTSSSSTQNNAALYDPLSPDPNAMSMGATAAQSGQKDVFDTSMIGSLIKSVRDDTMVDRHLGALMGGLDKIGRILFSFYWHKDKFEDRYGKKDMPELEDNLRNSFEQLGDLLLFLKQKTIESSANENISLDDNNV